MLRKSYDKSYTSRVYQSFTKLIMLIEFLQKQDCQLNEHLVMSPDLCLGMANTLQIIQSLAPFFSFSIPA